jgi:uncharacterized protein
MRPAIAALAKKMGLPIAVFRIEGGYGVQPRWSDVIRRGKMRCYVSRVIEPEEYANYTADELFALLQQELYRLWGMAPEENPRPTALDYVCSMHPDRILDYALAKLPSVIPDLRTLIREDPGLTYLYRPDLFMLEIDGNIFPLESQIIKQARPFAFISPESSVILYVREGIFEAFSSYPENNALYIQLLTGDMIVYGDEGRTKQRHIANEMIYKQVAETDRSDRPGWLRVDLTGFLRRYGRYLSRERENNILFTTMALRDYHYSKQKNNAFYHIQAIDLPFQNLDFYYLTMEEETHDLSRYLQ